MNAPIPGQGLTTMPGSMPCQNPPQFVHLDDLLESLWNKLNKPDNTVQIYGLLKAGVPAEALARTLLFTAFAHGACTPSLSMMALKTVVRQIVAIGMFMGLKHIKIKNHNPQKVKQLAEIQRVIDKFGSVDDDETAQSTSVPQGGIPALSPQSSGSGSSGSGIFSGIGA